MLKEIENTKRRGLPGATMAWFELFELGTKVSYHHRAGVARYKRLHKDLEPRGWVIVQGVNSREIQPMEANGDIPFYDGFSWNHMRHIFFDWPRARMSYGQYNKTVMVWPDEGQGYVIGKIRRSIGVSSSGYRDNFSGEFEPGYHSTDMYVDLYVIKTQYDGTDYILCPLWAVQEVT